MCPYPLTNDNWHKRYPIVKIYFQGLSEFRKEIRRSILGSDQGREISI